MRFIGLVAVMTLLLSPIALTAQDAQSPAAMFKQLDKNGDGVLKADEISAQQAKFFERLVRLGDDNKDGSLSAAEFAKALKPQPGVPADNRQGEAQARREQMQRLFSRLDSNGDGKLTLTELPEQARERIKPLFDRLGKEEITAEDFARVGRGGQQPGNNSAANRERFAKAMFDRMDKNQDGKLSVDEVPERVQPLIKRALQQAGLKDEDGVTQQQFAAAISRARTDRPGATRPLPSQPGQGRTPMSLFQSLDRNRDGRLNQDEISNASAVLKRLDKDGDGSVTLSEINGGRTMQRPDRDRPQMERPNDRQTRRPNRAENAPRADAQRVAEAVARAMKRIDANGDGKITRDEIPDRANRLKENFDRLDTNQDGSLSADEFKTGALSSLRNRQ